LLKQLTEIRKVETPSSAEGKSEYGDLVHPGDLQRAVLAGKKGIRVPAGETTAEAFYDFAAGARGAYVALMKKKDDLDNPNKKGKSVHTPEYITLAHELGHALNQLAGSATLNNEEIFKLLAGDVGTFEEKGPARKQWSNLEELLNIKGLENAIREEVGLAARGGHAAVVDEELIGRLNDEKAMMTPLVNLLGQLSRKKEFEKDQMALFELNKKPVKDLTQQQKRARCEEYEHTVLEIFKKIAKNKAIRAEARGKLAEFKDSDFKDLVKGLTGRVPAALTLLETK
jgi:hypothetical protein